MYTIIDLTGHRVHLVVQTIRQIVDLHIQPVMQLIAWLQTRFLVPKHPLFSAVDIIFESNGAVNIADLVAHEATVLFAMERKHPQPGCV